MGRPPIGLPAWRWLVLCVGVAVLSHLYMDWQGSYGWRPFLPWSARWYYLDWVAIADVFFWLVPLIGLAWGAERHWLPLSAVVVVGAGVTLVLILNASIVAPWVFVVYGLLCVVGLIGWVRYWFGPVARQRSHGSRWWDSPCGRRPPSWSRRGNQRFSESPQLWPRCRGALTSRTAVHVGGGVRQSGYRRGDDWRVPRNLRVPAVKRAIENTTDGRAMRTSRASSRRRSTPRRKQCTCETKRYARTGRAAGAVVTVRME